MSKVRYSPCEVYKLPLHIHVSLHSRIARGDTVELPISAFRMAIFHFTSHLTHWIGVLPPSTELRRDALGRSRPRVRIATLKAPKSPWVVIKCFAPLSYSPYGFCPGATIACRVTITELPVTKHLRQVCRRLATAVDMSNACAADSTNPQESQ
jgi:hypothetical protein